MKFCSFFMPAFFNCFMKSHGAYGLVTDMCSLMDHHRYGQQDCRHDAGRFNRKTAFDIRSSSLHRNITPSPAGTRNGRDGRRMCLTFLPLPTPLMKSMAQAKKHKIRPPHSSRRFLAKSR